MNNQQAAIALLRKLDLPVDSASVAVNDAVVPSEFTVLVYSPERTLEKIDTWKGHPVRFIFLGGPPHLHC